MSCARVSHLSSCSRALQYLVEERFHFPTTYFHAKPCVLSRKGVCPWAAGELQVQTSQLRLIKYFQDCKIPQGLQGSETFGIGADKGFSGIVLLDQVGEVALAASVAEAAQRIAMVVP